MKEYDLFVPLHFNDGKRIPDAKIASLKQRLVERFGGVTHFPQTNEGVWKVGRATFRDEITILRVLADDDAAADDFFPALKAEMERDLRQEEVLIIAREVTLV